MASRSNVKPMTTEQRRARVRAAMRRRRAQEVSDDLKNPEAPKGSTIEDISGRGEVSDDLKEPEMQGDSKAPVQDSVTARRKRKAHKRRAAEEEKPEESPEEESEDKEEKDSENEETVEENEDKVEDEKEDEEKREARIQAKLVAASRLVSLRKQAGSLPVSADPISESSKIASAHTKAEIDFAISCMPKVSAHKVSDKTPRKASRKAPVFTPTASKGDGSNASALFI